MVTNKITNNNFDARASNTKYFLRAAAYGPYFQIYTGYINRIRFAVIKPRISATNAVNSFQSFIWPNCILSVKFETRVTLLSLTSFASGAFNLVFICYFIFVINLLLYNLLFPPSGSNWKAIEGDCEGKTATCRGRIESGNCAFSHPIDVHLASRGIQGWPKVHVELFAVNALNNCWPIGYINTEKL